MAGKNEYTVFDYLQWRGDLTLQQDPFNEVDNLVLCIIAYINLRKIDRLWSKNPKDAMPIGDVCARLTAADEQLGLSSLDYIPVMRAAAETERFRDTRLFAFESRNDEAKQMQFAAVSFLLPDGSVFIAYRGTDTSLVGWKENFNMSYLETVPAQARATEYAQGGDPGLQAPSLPHRWPPRGGNLAAWAAVHLPEKLQGKRLLAAYNNDGPGFHADLLDTPAYRRVEDRLHTYIPESSIVGVLLVHAEDYDVIDSTSHAAMQHEALSWQVMGNRFCASGPALPAGADVRRRAAGVAGLRVSGGPGSLLRRPVQHPLHGWPCQDLRGSAQGRVLRLGGSVEGVCRSRRKKEADPDRDIRAAGHRREG